MDYYQIGQRIRKYRKALGLSQETLAERVGISVPHMSHIETGNTKLSLPVLVALAEALEVRTDDLLFEERRRERSTVLAEIDSTLSGCSARELTFLSDLIHYTCIAMRKNECPDS